MTEGIAITTVPESTWTRIEGTGIEVLHIAGGTLEVMMVEGIVILPSGPYWTVRACDVE